MNKLSSNLQKKIGMFCWNFAMIGMIGMVFGYLQKNVKLSLSLFHHPKKIEVHVLQNFFAEPAMSLMSLLDPKLCSKISSGTLRSQFGRD